jgi:hypothetical protein
MARRAIDFQAQYRRPEWQRKRLEIMDRDGWACTHCDNPGRELQIHHAFYSGKRKPWEYPDESLHTLCKECHEEFEIIRKRMLEEIGTLPLSLPMQVLGYIVAAKHDENDLYDRQFKIETYEMGVGVSHYWGLPEELLMAMASDSRYLICTRACMEIKVRLLTELRALPRWPQELSCLRDRLTDG